MTAYEWCSGAVANVAGPQVSRGLVVEWTTINGSD